jgi:hypothetical protein
MSNNNQEPSHDESLSNLPAGGTDVTLGEGQKGTIPPPSYPLPPLPYTPFQHF